MNYLSLEWDEVRPLVPNVSDERGQILVEDVLARAVGLVPALGDKLTDAQIAVAKAVIRKAVARWADSGSGGVTTKSQTAGPFQTSETFEARGDRPLFYDSEIDELRNLFRVEGEDIKKGKAYSLDPVICATPANPFDLGW